MQKKQVGVLAVIFLLLACVGSKDPELLKYENYIAQIDQRTARGEIAEVEADNLKMHAYQDYQEARRREEKQLLRESDSQFMKWQNQEINSALRRVQ